MANTYTQLYIQFVFAVKNRHSLISENWEDELYRYMGSITVQNNHMPIVINGAKDHIHALISMTPTQSPSDLMYQIKRSTSLWINAQKLVQGKFAWQEGFGAFSYSKSQLSYLQSYIENQKQHHKKTSFSDEYLDLLNEFEINFDPRYLFTTII